MFFLKLKRSSARLCYLGAWLCWKWVKKSSGRHRVGDKLKYLEGQACGINDHKDLGGGDCDGWREQLPSKKAEGTLGIWALGFHVLGLGKRR